VPVRSLCVHGVEPRARSKLPAAYSFYQGAWA
jgi:hypothetical protein